MDNCKFADVFYGNGEITSFAENGLASKWFYIKALCGNTTPHAVLPFGKMSVGAYSGGYPTGYGTHYPNSCGGIRKLWDKMKIKGFSHLHQSGTGAIGYYYNYAVTTPFYGEISEAEKFWDIENETAQPGYYSVEFNSIKAELTVTEDVAFHKYTFQKNNGRVFIDFSNDGLSEKFEEKYHSRAKNCEIKLKENKVFFSGILSGIKLFFCAEAVGENLRIHIPQKTEKCVAVFDFDGNEIQLKVAYSTLGFSQAENAIDKQKNSFEDTAKNAYNIWKNYLSVINIETENSELKEKFYSCFYHSIIKPAMATGENVLGVKDKTVIDFATFWDQYKTLYPLIFMLYPNESKKIADSIVNISETIGKICCSFGLSDILPCEEQAKMLGIIALCDAYYAGFADLESVEKCLLRELQRTDYKQFIESGFFERYTHILDVTDACLDVSRITKNVELKKQLIGLSENWKNAYDNDGLMSEKSKYYEGDRYTYSFRLQSNISERIELAGGKENFKQMLDDFFGFNKKSVKQITTTHFANVKIANTHYHRFEGFNNECDMETPFAYIFINEHKRLCDIISAAVNEAFGNGTGGLPGNNDSGGLSSCFMWLVLGIFPWAGTGKMLLGFPQIDKAEIKLSNGNILKIETEKLNKNPECVKEIYFNSEKISDYIISTEKIFKGGTLRFIIN
ncbi:MAG: glycoside hydrolase family 92 protein [Ruminococcus sp.]|nr:glycoside hydrolase family 92 protein [Candidatus Copronaster equi]